MTRTPKAVTRAGSKPGKVADRSGQAVEKVPDEATDAGAAPIANPMANLILADLVLRGGGALLRRAVETQLLGRSLGKGKAPKVIKGRSMGQTLLGTAAVRIATRSVPGAILIGGGLLAKALHDRKKARKP